MYFVSFDRWEEEETSTRKHWNTKHLFRAALKNGRWELVDVYASFVVSWHVIDKYRTLKEAVANAKKIVKTYG